MKVRDLTQEEARAIASLKRLAKRWPATLALRHMGSEASDLHVVFNERNVDPIERETVASIKGFHLDSTS